LRVHAESFFRTLENIDYSVKRLIRQTSAMTLRPRE